MGYESRILDRLAIKKATSSNLTNRVVTVKTGLESVSIQRKIVPWQKLIEAEIDLSNYRDLENSTPRLQCKLLASLVAKAPNLGGLTRTCETFSCSLLIMDDLEIVKDPVFLGSCVSAGNNVYL
jgi:hypothetical protein